MLLPYVFGVYSTVMFIAHVAFAFFVLTQKVTKKVNKLVTGLVVARIEMFLEQKFLQTKRFEAQQHYK